MFNILSHWFALACLARDRRRAVESLCDLSDAQLHDIGLARGLIEEQVREGLPRPSLHVAPARQRVLRPSLEGCG